MKLICCGKYEEESRELTSRLQQALQGLGQPQSDLAALQALVEGPEWTKDPHLAGVAQELVRSLAQHDLPQDAIRSSMEVDADLKAADERLKACPMRGEELEAYSGLLLEVNGLVTELQKAREARSGIRQRAGFAPGGGQAAAGRGDPASAAQSRVRRMHARRHVGRRALPLGPSGGTMGRGCATLLLHSQTFAVIQCIYMAGHWRLRTDLHCHLS